MDKRKSNSISFINNNNMRKVKVVFLGEQSVGKTSIITKFMFDSFENAYQATIGIDFLAKVVYTKDRAVRLQLWDTAGQERFRSLIPSYIRDSMVAVIVYDITKSQTFNQVKHWVDSVRVQRGSDVVIVIVGNKIDLNDKRQVSTQEAKLTADSLKALFVETSAKTGFNVKNLFTNIADNLPVEVIKEVSQREIEVCLKDNNDIVVSPAKGCNCFSF